MLDLIMFSAIALNIRQQSYATQRNLKTFLKITTSTCRETNLPSLWAKSELNICTGNQFHYKREVNSCIDLQLNF